MKLSDLRVKDIMTDNPVEVSSSHNIGGALGIMKKRGVSTLLVINRGRLDGTISYRDIVEKGIDSTAKVRRAVKKTPTITVNEPLVEAAAVLASSGLKALPVLGHDKKVYGVLARLDVVRTVASSVGFPGDLELRRVMSHPVHTVNEDETIGKTRDLMLENGVRRLPVLDKKSELVGIITFRDVAQSIYITEREKMTRGERSGEVVTRLSLPVKGLMTRVVQHLKINDSVKKAAKLMVERDISGVPILNELGELVGVITQADVVRLVTQLKKVKRHPIRIIGLEGEEDFVRSTVNQIVTSKVRKLSRIVRDLRLVTVNVKTYELGGERRKYSVRANLENPKIHLVSRASGWNLPKVVSECLSKLERKVARELRRE